MKINEMLTETQLDELKCWTGYKRVPGVPAGSPGSCRKAASEETEQLDELSPQTLARYKRAAGADARAADKAGDFQRGNKRFSGIVRATKKEFDHDAKKRSEQGVAEGKYDPAKDTFNPETHAAITKDGVDKLIPKSQLAKYKEQGWKERHSLKAFHKNREKQGVAEGLLDKFIKPEMKFKIDDYDEELHVFVTLGGERVASAVFNVVSNDLKAQDLSVRPKYRGQGIAKKMYDMLKSKGYTINRSQEQTAAGSHFWDKNKGRGSKVWEQGVAEDTNELGYHTRVRRGDFRPSKYGEDEYNYLHDLMNTSGDGSGPMLVTIDDKKIARQIAAMYGGDVEETGLGTYRIVQRRGNSPMGNEMPKLTGVAEGSLNEGQYEMMLRNGQVKKFVAKDDADAKRIAAGHGAKSVIKLKGGVPAGKVMENLDPDTQRLEIDIRNALENGDDYTAKQYAKMAPTPEAKKYLLNIIKQEMYGTEPGQGGVAEGLGDTKTQVVGKYKGWRFEIETQAEDDRYVKYYGAVSPEGKWHSLPKRATAEQFKQFVDSKGVTEGGVPSKYLSGTEKVDNISPVLKKPYGSARQTKLMKNFFGSS